MSKSTKVPKVLEGELLERFKIFWKHYPRKVSLGQAKKTWIKLKPTQEQLDMMLKALEWQVQLRTWQNKQYIPHPSTWLNAEKWEDEYDEDLMVVEPKSKRTQMQILEDIAEQTSRKIRGI